MGKIENILFQIYFYNASIKKHCSTKNCFFCVVFINMRKKLTTDDFVGIAWLDIAWVIVRYKQFMDRLN